MNEEVVEQGELCRCKGEIDRLYRISRDPEIWRGRCFQCGEPYIVIPEG